MDDAQRNSLAVALFSEILTNEQLLRARLSRVLPKGMELSHFSVLNHLARTGEERSPAQLAKSFHVTRGAMTNTLSKLKSAGYIHIRPDQEDARRKKVSVTPSGRHARDLAISAVTPMVSEFIRDVGEARVRASLPVLRELRGKLEG